MIATVTIYGANTDVAGEPIVADNTAIEALSGVVSAELDVDWVEPELENEGSIQNYLNNFQFGVSASRMVYNLITTWVDFPDSETDFTTLHPFANVIPYEFHWICLNDYKQRTYSSPTTKSLKVNLADYKKITEGGKMYWTIKLSEVKQNMARS